jgi:hypothetical protein
MIHKLLIAKYFLVSTGNLHDWLEGASITAKG